jgi:outer membrane lipopolysaccharide assembly protein LptE/RlpB
MRLNFLLTWLAVLSICLAGCGYRMIGGGSLPGAVETVAIPLLTNRTSETGLETVLTNTLIVQMNRRQKGRVVDAEEAQAFLGGTIDALGRETLARKGTHTSLERRVYVVVSLTLTRKNGEQLWKGSGLRAEQAYVVIDGDPISTDANRRRAIEQLAERLAETVVRRLTDDF